MKHIVFLLFILFGSFSFAQTTTKYDRIKELYDTGSAITLAELNGVWNGRCFYASDRDTALHSTFGMPLVNDDSAGPEFEGETFRIFVFDSYSTATSKEGAIENFKTQKIAPVEAASGIELNVDGVQYGVRKNGAYIILFNVTEDQHCYFYQPLK